MRQHCVCPPSLASDFSTAPALVEPDSAVGICRGAQTFYNQKWRPGGEQPDLRTRLKHSGTLTGDRTQKALRQELGTLEKVIQERDLGEPRLNSRISRHPGASDGDVTGNARPGEGLSLEQRLGSGLSRSEEKDVLASMVAKAAAPSHTATKADKRNMNKARLDDSGP